MVDHNLLLKKLMAYGFRNSAFQLIKDYFDNKSQLTKIGYLHIDDLITWFTSMQCAWHIAFHHLHK